MRHRSIRFRLTVWYSLMLFVGLVTLGSIMWLGVNYGMTASVDQRLADRLQGMVKPLGYEAGAIRERMRVLVKNPDLAVSVLPEAREELKRLATEEDRERLITEVLRQFTERQMRGIAADLPKGELLEVRDAANGLVAGGTGDPPGFPWPATMATEQPLYQTIEMGEQRYRVLARADTSLEMMPMGEVDLAQVARDVCEDYRVLAEARQLRFGWEGPGQSVPVSGNEAALRRLLVVLLDNAIHYTPAGGAVRVCLQTEAGEARLEVRDTGIGIPAEALPRVFERFYRADASRNRRSGGFGLGLSVAKWIAERHQASIEVESKEGEGSVFQVRISTREEAQR